MPSPDGPEERYAQAQEWADEAFERDTLAQAEADDWFDRIEEAPAGILSHFLDRVLS